MKTLKFTLLLIAAALCAHAQVAITSTTLSSAVSTNTQNSVVVASATNVQAGGFLYVDNEQMQVASNYVSGSTTVPVRRGAFGYVTPHLSGATVYVLPISPNYARTGLINYNLYGACTRANEVVLPRINALNGRVFDCFGGYWYAKDAGVVLYTLSIAPAAQPSAASPAIGTAITITGQPGGAQSATTSNGAAGAAITVTGGIGGVAGTSSGTGGAGGAVALVGGAGAGTVTGGAGGSATVKGGAGANGSGAGGSGGSVILLPGAVGTGGTGAAGTVQIKDAADATKIVSFATSGLTTATTRTVTFPDASITVSGATATDCGTAAGACSATTVSATLKIVSGTATSTSASPSTVAITGMPAFTSTATYKCFASNATTAANVFSVLTAGYVSTTAVTFTGPNTLTDVIRYSCIGY